MAHRILFGFHAVTARLKLAPQSVQTLWVDATRQDARMRQLLQRVAELPALTVERVGAEHLVQIAGRVPHQGVVARVTALPAARHIDQVLDDAEAAGRGDALVLLLDGVTDPHNLGACLRVADGAGVQAVVAPRDHAVGLNATVAKVASGAAESVPYLMVTNLARTIRELQERGVRVIGTADQAEHSLYETDLTGPLAFVLGAEGKGLRQLTRQSCDALVRIPMAGVTESLNVSVASAVCLFEAVRQRGVAAAGAGGAVRRQGDAGAGGGEVAAEEAGAEVGAEMSGEGPRD